MNLMGWIIQLIRNLITKQNKKFNMSFLPYLIIIVIHYIADFIFQDEEWAKNKSSSIKALLKHTLMYTYVWVGFIIFIPSNIFNIFGYKTILLFITVFPVITFLCHTVTDYFTSRVVKRLFEEKKYGSSIPNFGAFTMIGFDQVLHYIQLFATYDFIIYLGKSI